MGPSPDSIVALAQAYNLGIWRGDANTPGLPAPCPGAAQVAALPAGPQRHATADEGERGQEARPKEEDSASPVSVATSGRSSPVPASVLAPECEFRAAGDVSSTQHFLTPSKVEEGAQTPPVPTGSADVPRRVGRAGDDASPPPTGPAGRGDDDACEVD